MVGSAENKANSAPLELGLGLSLAIMHTALWTSRQHQEGSVIVIGRYSDITLDIWNSGGDAVLYRAR